MLSILFSVLLLIPPAMGVCQFCFGEASVLGCTGDMSTCPWKVGISKNAATVSAIVGGTATTAIIAIGKLLPQRFRKLFPRGVLDVITTILSKPKNGVEFDPEGKNMREVVGAIKAGRYSKSEAMIHWTERMDELDSDDESYDTKFKKLQNQFCSIRDLPNNFASEDGNHSVYLYVLAKLSGLICKGKDMAIILDTCGYCDVEDGNPSSSSASSSSSNSLNGRSVAATLVRPQSVEKMAALLNDWVLFFLALGSSPLILLPFLADVVYIPLSDGTLEWPVAFELLVIYLQEIEKNPDVWNLANIYSKSGAIDVRRSEAEVIAFERYPSHCFRSSGGTRGKSRLGGGDQNGGLAHTDLSNVVKHNGSSKKGCIAWNINTEHKAEHVDANGRCKFAHRCNQWVTDKGPNGQCLGSHKRPQCDYDTAKRSDKAVKA